MKVDIGLSEKDCHEIAIELNKILANEFVLYVKTLNYHWNIEGPDFSSLHKFLEDLYEQQLDLADAIAERVRQLGGVAAGTLTQFISDATIKEHKVDARNKDQYAMLEQLLLDHERIIKQMREAITIIQDTYGDLGTGNFLTDTMEKHEKIAWMLRSFFRD